MALIPVPAVHLPYQPPLSCLLTLGSFWIRLLGVDAIRGLPDDGEDEGFAAYDEGAVCCWNEDSVGAETGRGFHLLCDGRGL